MRDETATGVRGVAPLVNIVLETIIVSHLRVILNIALGERDGISHTQT